MSGYAFVLLFGTIYSILILAFLVHRSYPGAIALGFFALMLALASIVRAIENQGTK